MATAAISGKNGDVSISSTSISEVTQWTFTETSNNPAFASNKTAGFKQRVAGVKDGSGTIEGKWDPGDPATAVIEVGTLVTLTLEIDATQFYTVPSIIDSFSMTVNLDDGDVVGWTAEFSINGAWTLPIDASPLTLPEGFTFNDEGEVVDPEGMVIKDYELPKNQNTGGNIPVQSRGAPSIPAISEQAIAKLIDDRVNEKLATVADDIWSRLEKRMAGLPNGSESHEEPQEASTSNGEEIGSPDGSGELVEA